MERVKGKLNSTDRAWKFTVDTYNVSQNISVQRGCFAMMFVNTGLVTVTVKGMILFPGAAPGILGDARSIAAHKDDIYTGNLPIAFAAGAGPALEITQLYYTDYQS